MHPLLLAAAAAPKAVPTALATLLPQQAAPAIPQIAPKTWFSQHLPWLTHGLAGLFVLSALLLIFLLAIQTTKQEGLTGSIGGRVESNYRGRLGAEEQLKRWTGIVAVSFVVVGFVLSLTGI
jgi:protein translocase SecG subunit